MNGCVISASSKVCDVVSEEDEEDMKKDDSAGERGRSRESGTLKQVPETAEPVAQTSAAGANVTDTSVLEASGTGHSAVAAADKYTGWCPCLSLPVAPSWALSSMFYG